ncbi:MAG: AsmA-like C-terminal region-containing protein [Limisphaerales bacterium]
MRLQPGFWRKCRIGFRWCRISALLLVLVGLCAIFWLHRAGLPDFLKTRLVENLRAHGIELKFSKLRLDFARGFVAENVRIGGAKTSGSPTLSLQQLQLKLDYRALLHCRLQIAGLVLRQGELVWPFSPTNALTLDHIQTDLRFQKNDTWSLDHFQADFAGANLSLSGDIAHAQEIRYWKIFHGQKSAGFTDWRARLRKFSDTLGKIRFVGQPQLSVNVNGDARDIHSCAVRFNVTAPGVQTPWFNARNIQLTATVTAPAGAPTNFDASLDFWTNAQPFRLVWSARLTHLKTETLTAASVACGGFWQAPKFAVTNLSAELGGGRLDAQAQLNVATRELTFTNSACFDFHSIAALLTEKAHERLVEIAWGQLPSLRATGSLVLPAWTNRQPDWRGEVQPTIHLKGALAITNGVFEGVPFDLARTHFSYSHLVWQLPNFAIAQGKTRLEINGSEDDATKNYRWHVRGAFDPDAIRPFLTASNAARGFEIMKFTEPLALDVDVAGRLYDYNSIAANGRVALTNFSVRGETFGDVTAALNYTNRVLEFLHPLMHTGAQMMTADKVTLDFNTRLIHFTNGFSTADPEMIARAIGPKTAALVEPYHFLQPPTARVNGQVPLRDMKEGRDMEGVDMRFDVIKGAPFEWLKLKTTNIVGTICWQGQVLILTNVAAAFYGGNGNGFAYFDFRVPHEGADFNFTVNATNVNLHSLAADLSKPANHLEGTLSGQLAVTNADSRSWRTWNGYGRVKLRDGLLWDIPVFSILSPVLNAVSPGLGNSRATDASAKFSITNGVFFSDTLVIRAKLMRLEYAGTVDLKQNVNARATAQFLRDTWAVGPLISKALWPVSKLFEYKITGTLDHPKSEPVYVIPKLLLMPLHPIQFLQDILPTGDTNAPPLD